jgi:serine/threonine protein kinase
LKLSDSFQFPCSRQSIPTIHSRQSIQNRRIGFKALVGTYNGAQGWPLLLSRNSARMKSLLRLALAAWAKYTARVDTRRDVALKTLPESFGRDSDRLHRFEQESRAVAALNHPNILAVFDVGQHNGSPFFEFERLEGETLRAVLDRGSMPQRKAIDHGVQIAQALAAAHEKGIVHRDLKPESIFVTKDRRIKILDFGLAKLTPKASAAAAESDGVTLTNSHTVSRAWCWARRATWLRSK